jgi:hypothetical protein
MDETGFAGHDPLRIFFSDRMAAPFDKAPPYDISLSM